MEYGIYDILTLLGALGFFIYGMKIMSEGIQQAAGDKLRLILSAMTKNRFLGVTTGFLITGIVQSSSATTVMTVSFVNAGLLTLMESAGVMMGANIGTTVTAWFLSILGFKIKISAIALPIIAFGLPMYFVGNDKIKAWGQFIIGFALLFMGLSELKSAVPDIKNSPELLSFLSGYTDLGYLSILLFVGIGTALTIIVQSSSAAMALTLVMTFNGWIPFEAASAMVLGENIGTTITAELASLVGNVHAKRSARIHSTFNIIGVTWMVLILPYFLELVDYLTTNVGELDSPFSNPESIPYALSAFHTMFNTLNVLLMIAFVPLLVKIATKLVPSKGEDDEVFHLEFIGKSEILRNPEFSLEEVKKELIKYSELILKMKGILMDLVYESDKAKRKKLMGKLERYEDITDRMEEEIDDFVVKISEGRLSYKSSILVRSFLSITSDLERLGDILFQMGRDIRRGNKMEIIFTETQREGIDSILQKVGEAFDIMHKNLSSKYNEIDLRMAIVKELEINKIKGKLRKKHLKSVEKRDYDVKNGIVYKDLYTSCEKLGDHIINVSEAIAGILTKDDEDVDEDVAA
jgi:phosphate:Na+ symporter